MTGIRKSYQKTDGKIFCCVLPLDVVFVYSFSHNHGSVEHDHFGDSTHLPGTHFPLNHEDGRKCNYKVSAIIIHQLSWVITLRLMGLSVYLSISFDGTGPPNYPPQKLTWNLEMMVSNRNLLFQGSIFRFHVCFGGCNFFVSQGPGVKGKLLWTKL